MLKKKVLIAITLSLVLLMTACSGGKENATSNVDSNKTYTMKIAHGGSEAILLHKTLVAVGDKIEKDSNGRIKVSYYPNGQLGVESSVIEAVQNGDVEFTSVNTGAIAPFNKDVSVFSMPFIFPSEEVAYKVFDGEFGQKISKSIEEKMGVMAMGYTESITYRQMSSKKPVHTPDDLKGIKIRVMDNPIQLKIWESLGASPTPVPFAELYTALQQGTVDAQENPVELFTAMRFYEVQKYLILTNHVFTTSQMLMSTKFYNSLPADLQEVVTEACRYGVEFQREEYKKLQEELFKTLTDNGIEIIELTEQEKELFKEKSKPAVDYIRSQLGDAIVDELLEAIEAAK